MIPLRDGTEAERPQLDRLVQFDERSRAFPIRALVEAKAPRSYSWRCDLWLDQGEEGQCVSYALAHEAAARPVESRGFTKEWLQGVYWDAQRADPWSGGEYPGASPRYSGTSVLAGLQVLHGRGWFGAYRWAFGLNDLILGLGYNGPAVLGINWYSGMFDADSDGFIQPTGYLSGGHAILAKGVNVRDRTITLHNSWGQDWGQNGTCRMHWDHVERLLHERGEAAFILQRNSRATPDA